MIMADEQNLMEQFKDGLDAKGAADLAGRIIVLEGDLADLTARIAGLGETIVMLDLGGDEEGGPIAIADLRLQSLSADLAAALADAKAQAERADTNAVAVDAAMREIETLKADLAKATKAASARVARGERPAKPRRAGPMDEALSGASIADVIAQAEAEDKVVEIAFSDGKREIAGIPSIIVAGDVWRDHALGRMLRDPVRVHGPAGGQGAFTIAGYALLIGGSQVAYCARPDLVTVAAGREISLADDIYF